MKFHKEQVCFGLLISNDDLFDNDRIINSLFVFLGYTFERTAGQHKYGGPPPDWNKSPPAGCEIFVGNIPNYVYEDELIVLFEQCGKIYDLR